MGQTAPGGNLEVRQNGGDNGKNGGDKGASGILRLLGAAKLQSTLGTDNPR